VVLRRASAVKIGSTEVRATFGAPPGGAVSTYSRGQPNTLQLREFDSAGSRKAATPENVARYRQAMTHTPPAESALADRGKMKTHSDSAWKSARAIALLSLVIAVIAAGAAVAAWVWPSHQGPTFSSQQSTDAKTSVCSAYGSVRRALGTKITNPHPGDPVSDLSVAANTHLVFVGGGAYLRGLVDGQPATPPDLAKAVDSFANTLQQLGFNYIVRAPKPADDPLRQSLNSEMHDVGQLCGTNGGK
jgi:hypothetical protein